MKKRKRGKCRVILIEINNGFGNGWRRLKGVPGRVNWIQNKWNGIQNKNDETIKDATDGILEQIF